MLSPERLQEARNRASKRNLETPASLQKLHAQGSSFAVTDATSPDRGGNASRRGVFASRDANGEGGSDSKNNYTGRGTTEQQVDVENTNRHTKNNSQSIVEGTDAFGDGDAVIDMEAYNNAQYDSAAYLAAGGATDGNGNKLLSDTSSSSTTFRSSLVTLVKPMPVFPAKHMIFPDGRGETLHSRRAVLEVVAGDRLKESLLAYQQLSVAGEAIALHRGGQVKEASTVVFEALTSTSTTTTLNTNNNINSPAPQSSSMSGFAALTLLDDGLARRKAVYVSAENIRRFAAREVREYVHHEEDEKKVLSSSSSSSPFGGSPLKSLQILPDSRPTTLIKAAANLVSRHLGDPVDSYIGRTTSSTDGVVISSTSTPSSSSSSSSVVGAIPSTIGSASWVDGAASASEYSTRAELNAHQVRSQTENDGMMMMNASSSSSSSGSASSTMPMLRLVRPLAGDASELALATATSAMLYVQVGGVAFRDHPLFAREDYLVSGIRALYAEYIRRMRSGTVSSLDMRLRSLLAYSMGNTNTTGNSSSEGGSSSSTNNADAAITPVYDFEADSLSDMCARAGAVLEALSERYEDVTGAADVMRRIWTLWEQVKVERQTTQLTLTTLRLDAKEMSGTGPSANIDSNTGGVGSVGGQQQTARRPATNNRNGTASVNAVPVLHPILYATALLLDRLAVLAAEWQADGSTTEAIDIANRLVATGGTLLSRIRQGEMSFGNGYGCGGLGSGIADIISYLVNNNATNNGGGAFPGAAGAIVPTTTYNATNYAYPGAREFIVRLYDDEQITPDIQCPPGERKRRALIRGTYLVAQVLVNDKPVALSQAVRLNFPQFTSACHVTAAIRLFRRPASIAIRILDASSYLTWLVGPSNVSQVLVPVPGQADLVRGGGGGGGASSAGAKSGGILDGNGDEDGISVLATSALEPVTGIYEFSSTQAMNSPVYAHVPVSSLLSSPAAAAAAAATGGAGGGGAGALSTPTTTNTTSSSLITCNRLTCGDVSVTCAWEVSGRTETGMTELNGGVNAGSSGGVGKKGTISTGIASSSSSSTSSSSLIALPLLDSSSSGSTAVQSADFMTVLRVVGELGSAAVSTVVAPFSNLVSAGVNALLPSATAAGAQPSLGSAMSANNGAAASASSATSLSSTTASNAAAAAASSSSTSSSSSSASAGAAAGFSQTSRSTLMTHGMSNTIGNNHQHNSSHGNSSSSSAGISASSSSMGDVRLIREFAALPIPRAMSTGASGQQQQQLQNTFNPAGTALGATISGNSNTTLGSTSTPATTLANTSMHIGAIGTNNNNNNNGRSSSTLRRSQAMAAAEQALENARLGVSSVAIPVQGIDPNDPRSSRLAMGSGGGGGNGGGAGSGVGGRKAGRSTRFRVAALPQSLLFQKGSATSAMGVAAFGSGAMELSGSGGASSVIPLPGKQRHQLLRLRGERPDLFRDVHEAIPLLDDDIQHSIVLRELLRSALMSLGYSEQADDAMQYGPQAYLQQGAKALGVSGEGISGGGSSGSNSVPLLLNGGAGNTSAASVAKARLLLKVRDFLARVRATPGGSMRFLNRILLSGVVKELSLPALKAVINFTRIVALLAPRRKLRPRAIDLGIPLDLGPAGTAGGIGMELAFGSGMRGLTPQHRITVQVVRARNVPVRRPYISRAAAAAILASRNTNAADSFTSPGRGSATPGGFYNSNSNDTGFQPPRTTTTISQNNHESFHAGQDEVVTVVEARFQGRAARTSACPGANPQWNEILSLPFIPPAGDVTPARLADVQDLITLSLFDEMSVETRADDRDKMTTIVRRERRYLGSVTIPFVSLYAQGGLKLETRLETPIINLGYRTPSVVHHGASTLQAPGGARSRDALEAEATKDVALKMFFGEKGSGAGGGGGNSNDAGSGHASLTVSVTDPVGMNAVAEANRRATHLYVHISVDPALPAVDGDDDDDNSSSSLTGNGDEQPHGNQLRALHGLRFDGSPEHRRILELAAKWGDHHSAMKETMISTTGGGRGSRRLPRVVKPITSNLLGEAVLVTRYLHPQAPPPDAAAAVVAYMQAELASLSADEGSGNSMMTPPRRGGGGSMHSSSTSASERRLLDDKNGGNSSSFHAHLDPLARMPIVPPNIVRMASVDAVARYVSLVPFMADSHAFGSSNVEADLWATSQEFLDMGAGDAEEHAILLHNYLQWFEQQQDTAQFSGGGNNTNILGGGGNSSASTTTASSNPANASSASAPGWKSYILLGRAQPDGETTWVMRQNASAPGLPTIFINSCTSRSYFAADDTCPLVSIGMLATHNNIWANIQPFTEPWRISFDLSDPRCWAPFFTPVHPHPGHIELPSIQGQILYRFPDTKLASALEIEIAASVSSSLRAWRPRYMTRFRGDVAIVLKSLLLELEARACGIAGSTFLPVSDGIVQVFPGGRTSPVTVGVNGVTLVPGGGGGGGNGTNSLANFGGAGGNTMASSLAAAVRDLSAEHQAILERTVARYHVQGFPLHMTFTDLDTALAAVKCTGIHRIEDESVQFAVSVVVIPYPNDIFSVWIYAVSLLPA